MIGLEWFSGDHFSRGPFFRGPSFRRPFFRGPFFSGTIFRGPFLRVPFDCDPDIIIEWLQHKSNLRQILPRKTIQSTFFSTKMKSRKMNMLQGYWTSTVIFIGIFSQCKYNIWKKKQNSEGFSLVDLAWNASYIVMSWNLWPFCSLQSQCDYYKDGRLIIVVGNFKLSPTRSSRRGIRETSDVDFSL